jgi:hypothetical protein
MFVNMEKAKFHVTIACPETTLVLDNANTLRYLMYVVIIGYINNSQDFCPNAELPPYIYTSKAIADKIGFGWTEDNSPASALRIDADKHVTLMGIPWRPTSEHIICIAKDEEELEKIKAQPHLDLSKFLQED